VRTPTLAAQTVLHKYSDARDVAGFARDNRSGLPAEVLQLVRRYLPRPSPVLVVGCGTGCEALALAQAGYTITALDLSAAMLAQAQETASALGVAMTCHIGDVATVTWPDGISSWEMIYFSGAVYSHIPTTQRRRATLQRLRQWLVSPGFLALDRSFYCAPSRRAWSSRTLWLDRWRTLRQHVFPWRTFPEPGDRMVPTVSPGSDPHQPCFVHVFQSAEEVRNDLRHAGFQPVVEQTDLWLWQVSRS